MDHQPDADQSWTELNRLLDAVLNLPPEQRSAWLATLPPEHVAHGPRLRSLLARSAQIETNDFLGELPRIVAASDEDAAPRPAAGRAGDTIGPYRLIRELGSGGMGAVWLAERTDGILNRPVALKLPHLATRHGSLAERLAREREILATLAHPHIARLYDAGVTPEGQSYLALEYIEGTAIDEYCATHGLGLRQRLRLFLQIADAVAYAHGKLVVHRDLKPANVLVTNEGEARLLDFGIAKLLEGSLTHETQLTQFVGAAFTPDYASPEQIRGEPLSVGSDVYSLGVILFRLLTGERPYRLERETRGALEDAVLKAEPVQPSDLAARGWRREIRGDLDTIILKCLKKSPDERYLTVHALAQDLERFLDGRPVLAQPDSRAYRLRKFVARNKLAVGAAAAVVAAVLAGAGVALWQARAAVAEQRRAEQVRDFIASIFQNADPFGESGHSMSAVELLRQARGRIDSVRTSNADERVLLLNTLGSSMLNLQDTDGAEEVMQQAVNESRALDPRHIEALRARRLQALVLVMRGRFDQAQHELAVVIPVLRHDPERYSEELVAALLARTTAYVRSGAYDEAERSATELLNTTQQLLGERRPESVEALMAIAYAHNYRNRRLEGHEVAKRAYELARQVFPGDGSHPTVNNARMQYAVSLIDMDRVDEAVDLMLESLGIAERIFGKESRIVGEYCVTISEYLSSSGQYQQGVDAAERGMRIVGKDVDPNSITYAQLLDAQSGALVAARRGAESLPVTTRAREIVVANFGPTYEHAFVLQVKQGMALAQLGRTDEARRVLAEVVEKYQAKGYSSLSTPLYQLGFATRLGGDPLAAAKLQQRSFEAIRPGLRAERQSAKVLVERGLDRLELKDYAGAQEDLDQALAIFRAKFRNTTTWQADALVARGRLAMIRGDPATALTDLEEADQFWRALDADNRWAGEAALWLGRCYRALGRSQEASTALQRAAGILAKSPIAIDRQLLALTRDGAQR
ncbi:MAG TPA: protein kinase [Steroidobacteraceae bacterium]|jgi:eukaryotic-like serine/threonine-protein kinase|nr:protein kinase [Steroidobacteraceae bacterium]